MCVSRFPRRRTLARLCLFPLVFPRTVFPLRRYAECTEPSRCIHGHLGASSEGCRVFANCSLSRRFASRCVASRRLPFQLAPHTRRCIRKARVRVLRGSRVMRVRRQFTRGKDERACGASRFWAEMQRRGRLRLPVSALELKRWLMWLSRRISLGKVTVSEAQEGKWKSLAPFAVFLSLSRASCPVVYDTNARLEFRFASHRRRCRRRLSFRCRAKKIGSLRRALYDTSYRGAILELTSQRYGDRMAVFSDSWTNLPVKLNWMLRSVTRTRAEWMRETRMKESARM